MTFSSLYITSDAEIQIATSNGVFTCKYLKSSDKVGAFVLSEWGTTISSNVFLFF